MVLFYFVVTLFTAALFMGSLQHLRDDLGSCKTLRFTNGTGAELAGGDIHFVADRIGPVLETTPDGEDGVIITETASQGYSLPKEGVAINRGADAYWSAGDGWVTPSTTESDGTTATTRIGYFAEDAAAADDRVQTVIEQQ